ncbi:anti-repressor SinI family protein [Bacillus niameyensis]|nr:anti-repressor SinI family protein [Bacillus niameyensis]
MINSKKELDKEWVELIKEALAMGIPTEMIREFLRSDKKIMF